MLLCERTSSAFAYIGLGAGSTKNEAQTDAISECEAARSAGIAAGDPSLGIVGASCSNGASRYGRAPLYCAGGRLPFAEPSAKPRDK